MSLKKPTINSAESRPEQEVQQKKPRKDVEAVKDAQNFFYSLGLAVENDGLVTRDPTDDQLAKLREWHDQTRDVGIDMPTEKAFYEKVLLAISLWRQQEGEKTNYLLGKGVGVEVALRGSVAGRIKRPIEFSYRSHSDFELYAVDYKAGEDGANLGGGPVYTEPFRRIFGSQEYFPVTKTKGLKNIPPTLLYDTAEVVDLGGVEVRIPQLELLFLDKYIVGESTPRPEGYDAELLARQYVLDRAKIHQYLDQFVIEPAIAQIQAQAQRDYRGQLDGIRKNIAFARREFEAEEIEPTPQDLVTRINKKIQSRIDIHGTEKSIFYSGICLNLWETLTPEQIDADGNIIDQEFLQRLKNKAKDIEIAAIERYKNKHQELDKLFDDIGKEFVAAGKAE